ncbi:nitric oxide synthase 1-like [Ptychodera flava]|uniref:nitric oxide synthase 1-like n=1 Tax=Ptychodera flava TaxID=63121 RepID=UPI00396A8C1A
MQAANHTGCPVTGGMGCPAKFSGVKLKNFVNGRQNIDTLHSKAIVPSHCNNDRCMGSIMFPPVERKAGEPRTKEETSAHAKDFIDQYYTSIDRTNTPEHKHRMNEVLSLIEENGVYDLTEEELSFGVKTAWRNAPRCIGRIHWTRLQIFDGRKMKTAKEMFQLICKHIKYATNNGNLRSAITVFPPRTDGHHDFRVWNALMIRYAGYTQPDGSIIGDPAGVEFTEVCQRLGWKGRGGRFDVLPVVLQANGEKPEWFEIPSELVLEVEFSHPKYDWFAELGLRWYALPGVSNMMFDCGGLEFTGCPFSGWYMSTEIGTRDLCDAGRYNVLGTVGKRMGLDTSNTSSLWKDKALVEVNIAVLHSFQKKNVTITDHHQASELFVKHMENEQRLRGGCPADWVWIVPPMSGSITPVFHQEMLFYKLKPSYEYQDDPWKRYKWNDGLDYRKKTFREAAIAVQLCASLMMKAMGKRIKATILYATETGTSEAFATSLGQMFNHAFHAQVMCMDDYDITNLVKERLLMVVTSTFGNGDAPANGEKFAKSLRGFGGFLDKSEKREPAIMAENNNNNSKEDRQNGPGVSDSHKLGGNLANLRFSVFGLGSRAYTNFCAFAHTVDSQLSYLGGTKILDIGEGDELRGQEQSFNKWAREVFAAACGAFDVGEGVNIKEAGGILSSTDHRWAPGHFKLVKTDADESNLCETLSKLHGRKVMPCKLNERKNLQAEKSSRSTILVKVDTKETDFKYEPGDHLAIFPSNEKQLVDKVLKRMRKESISPDVPVSVQCLQQQDESDFDSDWAKVNRLPVCSLRTALTKYLDITTPPTPQFMQVLSTMCTRDKERKILELLGEGNENYEYWSVDNVPNLADVLDEFPSIRLEPSFLLTELPLMKPRYFSISSSPNVHHDEIHATVAVLQYRTQDGKGKVHNGVCSSWLNRIQKKEIVPCFVRASPSFHLPMNPSVPIIMVGPGTGIAPFRSFWHQRNYDINRSIQTGNDVNFGDMTLLFGCRNSQMDDIYKKETEYMRENHVLTNVMTALSRERGQPKKYVQDLLKEHAQKVGNMIVDQGGHFYVCGDVSMATDVCDTLKIILEMTKAMNETQAKEYIATMKNDNRYHEDIFGTKHKTTQELKQRYLQNKETIPYLKTKTGRSSSLCLVM